MNEIDAVRWCRNHSATMYFENGAAIVQIPTHDGPKTEAGATLLDAVIRLSRRVDAAAQDVS